MYAAPNSVEMFTVGPNPMGEIEEEGAERDNANLRLIANRTIAGDMTPAVHQKLMTIAAAERSKWAPLLPGSPIAAPVSGESWVNLGPTDAFFEYNGTLYPQVDSGRPTAVAVDPRDANVVYLATSGGGVWKTYDFETKAPNPTWHPITENLGNLAIGSIAIDATHPDKIIIGTGDAFDVQEIGRAHV